MQTMIEWPDGWLNMSQEELVEYAANTLGVPFQTIAYVAVMDDGLYVVEH